MKLNDICKKLVKANLGSYKILMFCLILATTLFTSYGLLIFSPTITDVIIDGGSTQMIAYSIYVAFSIACLMFIMYSHSLFMKYKSQEIGVFISLGINRNNIKNILLKELKYILPITSAIGMILALPFTYIVWTFITMLTNHINTGYQIGWLGFLGGIIFSIIVILAINYKTSRYIKKIDIIKILKNNEAIEDLKVGNYKLGILGAIMIPVGIFGANFNMRGIFLESSPWAKYLFFGMVIVGLYLLCASFTALGELAKKVNKKNYYNNIMFYNLLKLKGKQYTTTLFTVTILIGITIFAMCFSFVNLLEKNSIAEILSPFDYSVLKSSQQNNLLEKNIIDEIASKHNVKIKDYNETEFLTVVNNFSQEDIDMYGIQGDPERCISESEYNKLYNENIDVSENKFYMVCNEKSMFKLDRYQSLELSSLGSDKKIKLEKEDDIFKQLAPGEKGGLNLILDDKDYEKLKLESPSDATEINILFNVDNWMETYDFFKELETWIIDNNKNGILVAGDAFDRIYNNLQPEFVHKKELSQVDYRDWVYKIDSRIYLTTDGLNIEMVYPLLFGYISLLAFIASAMILYIKVLNTSWQDIKVYQNISLLGAKKKSIKSIITKQLMIIFMMPTIVGCALGVMIELVMTSQNLTANIYRNYAIIFALLFALLQFIVFVMARRTVLKQVEKEQISQCS